MVQARRILAILLFIGAFPHASFAATLSCSGGVVSIGDSRVDLLGKCGEPSAKESHQEEISERIEAGVKQKIYITVEDWTYNYGPTQFMRIVTLRNGTIAEIRTGNYGYPGEAGPGPRECSERIATVGDTKAEIAAKCGEPFSKESHLEESKERLENGEQRSVFVTVEEWTYNLGPNRFLRILTFRNGRLAEIKTGGYGY